LSEVPVVSQKSDKLSKISSTEKKPTLVSIQMKLSVMELLFKEVSFAEKNPMKLKDSSSLMLLLSP